MGSVCWRFLLFCCSCSELCCCWCFYLPCRCWMTGSPQAMLAHYCTTMMLLALVFCSGLVMLGLVYRQIRYRNEWRQQRVAFFSMWGLSCLFGTSWCLAFLDFGFLSTPVLFLFCILNSFQGV